MDQGRTPEERAGRSEAKTWLLEKLADGPVATKDLQKAAREDGLTWRTLEVVKPGLGVEVKRVGFGREGHWSWVLPSRPTIILAKDRTKHRTIDPNEKTAPESIESIDPIDPRSVFSDPDDDPFAEE
jgi:hypothetical protein